MTIPFYNARRVVSNTGAVSTITVNFRAEAASDVHVYAGLTENPDIPDVVELTQGIHYTVDGIGALGYSVTLADGAAWGDYSVFVVFTEYSVNQPNDVDVGGPFGKRFEDALDRQTFMLQSFYDIVARAVRMPITQAVGTNNELVPSPGELIGWNEDGTALTSYADVAQSTAEAIAAADRADAAADDAEALLATAQDLLAQAQAALANVSVVSGMSFASQALFAAAVIPAPVQLVTVAGYHTVGVGEHRKRRISTPSPVEAWHSQSADGAWWVVAEQSVSPEMLGAKPNDNTFDSGPAVQAAFNMAFVVDTVRQVSLRGGEYHCWNELRPGARQSVAGNYDLPYQIACFGSALVARGTPADGNTRFFEFRSMTTSRSVRYIDIIGTLVGYNDGGWTYGFRAFGVNWSNFNAVRFGKTGTDGSTPERMFLGRQIEHYSNNAKGGLWNHYGSVIAVGGALPFYVGPDANANQFDSVFGGYGTDGAGGTDEGQRNSYGRISVEMGVGTLPRFGWQFSSTSAEWNVNVLEAEGADADNTLNPAYQGALWLGDNAKGYNINVATFHALANGGKPLIKYGAANAGRINRFNPSSGAMVKEVRGAGAGKRVVDTTMPSSALGVSNAYPSTWTVLIDGIGAMLDTEACRITNNTPNTVILQIGQRLIGSTDVAAASADISQTPGTISIAAGASFDLTDYQIGKAASNGLIVGSVLIRARVAEASVTGSLRVEATVTANG